MPLAFLSMVVVVTLGVLLGGWADLYHGTIGVPLLACGWFLVRPVFWGRRNKDRDVILHKDDVQLLRIVRGGLTGFALSALLFGGFWLTAAVGLDDWFYGRDCAALFTRLDDLRADESYARIVTVIDERLQQPVSPSCSQQLLNHKAQALVATAKRQAGPAQLQLLDAAAEVAIDVTDPALGQLIVAERAAATAQLAAAKHRDLIDQQQQALALNEAIHQLATQQPRLLIHPTRSEITLVIPGSLFALGDDTLGADGAAMLRDIATFAQQQFAGKSLSIIGHSDALGSPPDKRQISRQRADNIKAALLQYGIPKALVTATGVGDSVPLTHDSRPEEQAQNRRVEIVITK